MRARLFIALGLTLALAPSLLGPDFVRPKLDTTADLAAAIAFETIAGATLGLAARFVVAAVETLAVSIAMSIGHTSTFAGRMDESDSIPEIAAFVSFAATALIFAADMHWLILSSVFDSFSAVPLARGIGADIALPRILDTLSFAFPLALRIASPFLAFGLLTNLAFGLVNKVAPQIAMYFISVPFVVAGGLALLYVVSNSIFSIFAAGFSYWLSRG